MTDRQLEEQEQVDAFTEAGMPVPRNEDGTVMTRQQLADELPAGARQEHIDVSMRNLMVAPNKTLAALVRKGFERGTGDPNGHVHHAVCVPMGEMNDPNCELRVTLFIADEPPPEPEPTSPSTGQAETIGKVHTARKRRGKRSNR